MRKSQKSPWTFLVLCLFLGPAAGYGQLLRIGPLELEVSLDLGLEYSSNIDGVPNDEEPELEKKDYFITYGISLSSSTDTTPDTSFSVNSSLDWERHFVRDDLDQTSDPFGDVELQYTPVIGRFEFILLAKYLRSRDTVETEFISGERRRRDENDIQTYSADSVYTYGRLTLDAGYSISKERHDDEAFRDGDADDEDMFAGIDYEMTSRVSGFYNFGRDRTTFRGPEVSADQQNSEDWEGTHFAGFEVLLLERPQLTYTVGMEREDDGGEGGDWELIHQFGVSDDYDFTETITLSFSADYTIEDQEESDDIAFTYTLRADHELGRKTSQSLNLDREPRDTFGASTDTDTTSYGYSFERSDLLIPDLSFRFDYSHDINKPVEGPEEKSDSFTIELDHSKPLNRKLDQALTYAYSYEDSDVSSPTEEHNVRLQYSYTF